MVLSLKTTPVRFFFLMNTREGIVLPLRQMVLLRFKLFVIHCYPPHISTVPPAQMWWRVLSYPPFGIEMNKFGLFEGGEQNWYFFRLLFHGRCSLSVLKSGCKRTQNVWKTKTFINIVTVLKAWILNDLHQQSESSKIKNLLKEKFFLSWRSFSDRLISNWDMGLLHNRHRSYLIFETSVSTY